MASDNRDWYRDWWRSKTGYTERASFRVGHEEHQRAKIERRQAAHASAWRRNMAILALVVFLLISLAILK